MTEFVDENRCFLCLEETEGDVSHSNKHLEHLPFLHYHHIFLITGGVVYQYDKHLFMKLPLYFWQGNYYEEIWVVRNSSGSLVSVVGVWCALCTLISYTFENFDYFLIPSSIENNLLFSIILHYSPSHVGSPHCEKCGSVTFRIFLSGGSVTFLPL